jgi:hypothetical protein
VAASLILEGIVGQRIDGIIGSDLFQDHIIELNYQAQGISFRDPREFHYPLLAESLVVLVKLFQ